MKNNQVFHYELDRVEVLLELLDEVRDGIVEPITVEECTDCVLGPQSLKRPERLAKDLEAV